MRLRADRRSERRSEAQKRNADWAALSPKQKLTELDQRLGKGTGATRQRKLLTQLAEEKS